MVAYKIGFEKVQEWKIEKFQICITTKIVKVIVFMVETKNNNLLSIIGRSENFKNNLSI